MKNIMKNILIAFLLLFSINASALQESTPLATDARIREVSYSPDEVFKFTAHYKIQSSIEFEQGEDIRTISVGDSDGWQIVPSGNRIFLKPVELDADTNMTVVTNQRVYHFEIYAREQLSMGDDDMVFVMRFVYGGEKNYSFEDENSTAVPNHEIEDNPSKYNFAYTISGSDNIAPIRIFDDGEFTFFQFKDINADLPAFFKVDSERREAIINYRTVGDYVVVERVSPMFTLRHGRDVVCVFNEARPLKLLPNVETAKEEDESWF